MKVDKPDVDKQSEFFNEHTLRTSFRLSDDVVIKTHHFGTPPVTVPAIFIYCSGMLQTTIIYESIMPELLRCYEKTKFIRREEINREVPLQWTAYDYHTNKITSDALASHVFEGQLLFCLPSLQTIWAIDIAKIPGRTPQESATEISIRGPKDGFIEELCINVALIRKRLKTVTLACEYFTVGSKSLTEVGLLYVSNIANADAIAHIRSKIEHIHVEHIISTGDLEEQLTPSAFALFPKTHYTGRPDFAVDCLLNGRFIILVGGNPTAIIAPVNLFLLMKSPEDAYFPIMSANIGRVLRFTGLLTTIFLPGFYIAFSTFHADQVPYSLLATIAMGRHGLPMESALEMFFIMCLMELFREAGVRLPSSIGQTLTVVGGLIIGDAAIRAGLVSPLMIVITAITVVSGSTLVNQALTSTTIILRFASFILGATLGMYGFILSFIMFVIYLANTQSFGVPYLAPAAPLNLSEVIGAFFKLPLKLRKRRPSYLKTPNPNKKGSET
ncbi:spore germination protein [Paenibacillus sp. GSMTC-2017]|uniref:spore germination protein n=1 Tax=Paenibacillus sp. GSMTC-2017 TaxID=2794350 RepID=UPI0018D87FDF|nr:spore germination protein [Paenibacillus sp. GSMTC-2017]MBH5319016.1 spore germination protein [Paenibacillus sp. GSMTC-2017]